MKYQEQDAIWTPPIEPPGSPLQIFFLPKNPKTKESHSSNRLPKAASLKIFKVRSKSHVNIDQIFILNPYAANTFLQWKLLRVSLNRHYRLMYFPLYCLDVKLQFLCYFYSDKDSTIVSQ